MSYTSWRRPCVHAFFNGKVMNDRRPPMYFVDHFSKSHNALLFVFQRHRLKTIYTRRRRWWLRAFCVFWVETAVNKIILLRFRIFNRLPHCIFFFAFIFLPTCYTMQLKTLPAHTTVYWRIPWNLMSFIMVFCTQHESDSVWSASNIFIKNWVLWKNSYIYSKISIPHDTTYCKQFFFSAK